MFYLWVLYLQYLLLFTIDLEIYWFPISRIIRTDSFLIDLYRSKFDFYAYAFLRLAGMPRRISDYPDAYAD